MGRGPGIGHTLCKANKEAAFPKVGSQESQSLFQNEAFVSQGS